MTAHSLVLLRACVNISREVPFPQPRAGSCPPWWAAATGLSHQPHPEPAGARCQLELKGSSSELEAGVQPARNLEQAEPEPVPEQSSQLESGKSCCFPAACSDPGSEQAGSVGKHWGGRSRQGQLLSGGLCIFPVPLECFACCSGMTAPAYLNACLGVST